MTTTPQERMALGVAILLLALGVGVRTLRSGPPEPQWSGVVAADSAGRALDRQVDAVAAETAREQRRRTPMAPGERLDPNTASADELARLPRVGEGLARRIVERRERHGPFRNLADLDSVSGIGPALLASAAPHLTLPPASAAPAVAAPRASQSARPGRASAAQKGAPMDVNHATAAQLESLPGIGPALAARIVAHRARNGPFRSPDDLRQVSGIGTATLERLRPRVRATP